MDDALTRDEQDALEADGWVYAGGGLGEGGQPYLKFTKNRETFRGSRVYWRAVIADIKPMSDLHDETIRNAGALVADLRGRLAALESSNAAFQRNADEWRERALRAEAERDALKKALVDWITADGTDAFVDADLDLEELARGLVADEKE